VQTEHVGPKYRSIELNSEQRREVETLVSPGSFRVLTRGELPSFIPEGLRAKCAIAYVAASSGPEGNTYMMCDSHRVDAKAQSIDQEPLVCLITTGGAQSIATLVHHGNWHGRSYDPPAEYWGAIKASGIGAYYNSAIPLGAKEGPLSDLPQCEVNAFEALIEGITERDR
jgi:hypothetical protein